MNWFQAFFSSTSSRITEIFPRFGAWFLDWAVRGFVGSGLVYHSLRWMNRRRVAEVQKFRRFLVNPDTHIGDSIMGQSVAEALHDFFPDCEVDYVTNKTSHSLIEGNPYIKNCYPLYSGTPFASEEQVNRLKQIMRDGQYDLCINICPFLMGRDLEGVDIVDFTTHSPTVARNDISGAEINHFAFQYRKFVQDILLPMHPLVKRKPLVGLTVMLSDQALSESEKFVEGFDKGRKVVMFNPDTASPYTRMPFADQVALIRRFADRGVYLLVGEGHTDKGIGWRLMETLPVALRAGVKLIPSSVSLDTYSALIDKSDVFVTGDTGPMHIAAARKFARTGQVPLRNRTAVLSVFGCTPARMSGYDSFQPGYLPPNQDAPAWSVVSESVCRNITCLNKLYKDCRTVRCFDRVDFEGVIPLILRFLDGEQILSDSAPTPPRSQSPAPGLGDLFIPGSFNPSLSS
ncbi:MAG: glycosyltransferase family 9 protein [Deltaproteobacteria bacterium]|nr:glycosyltransferase family 9 protein [Deltaproteobacteria bacterium]MBI3295148.1 glycosyltransferase family 9 protein [Deltaproteobacteria bacterium]